MVMNIVDNSKLVIVIQLHQNRLCCGTLSLMVGLTTKDSSLE
ncbi:hypothetical protein [Bacillus sp. FJAT-27445]|nr:hypothetical protein [Bacillus sp. FJAT-27445]